MLNTITKDLLKEVPSLFQPVTLSAHEERLEKVLGRHVIDRLLYDEEDSKWLKGLKAAGFHSVVTTDWALRFKYHASVIGHNVCEDLSMREDHSVTWYRYVGDIPNLALDALEAFKKVSCNWKIYIPEHTKYAQDTAVTIHSMESLPMKMERSLPQVDPVLIGWMRDPSFILGLSGWASHRDYVPGVIIAVWDEFKEVVDYKVKAEDIVLQ